MKLSEIALRETMRHMGEPESSVRYWATREVLWNGERVVVEAPRMNLPATDTGD